MNKNTLVTTIITGLALAAPLLHADSQQGAHTHDGPLQYIDASGNVKFIAPSGSAQPQNMYQDHQTHAGGQSHGQSHYGGTTQAEQTEIVYYDAETGEPVPAELVGTEYMETGAAGSSGYANPPAQSANTYHSQNTMQQPSSYQAAHAEQSYAQVQQPAAPQRPEQPGEDFIYVDAVTGETLTKEEAEAALAYQNGNTGQQQTEQQPVGQQQNMAYNAPAQDTYQQQNNTYNTYAPTQPLAAAPPPPTPQNAGGGYEMYANTAASGASTEKAEADPYHMAAQQAQSARISKAQIERAVKEGNLDLLRNLHAKGANLLQPDGEGMTYLHKAAAAGKLGIVKFLLRAGIDPNARTVKDWTPLHHAARFGRADVVKQLLAAGANPQQANSDGFSPHRLAMNVQQTQVAALLH